jgi:uncharacterized UPF0146 family protein
MGLATVLGLRRLGFFIPYGHAATVPGPGSRPAYAALGTLFGGRRAAFLDHLGAIEGHAAELERIAVLAPAAPRWGQSWFPRLDAAAAYAMVRRLEPRRIVEVGCGHSTRFLARAVADGDLATRITAIDPAPRADIRGLGVEVIEATLQDAGLVPFAELGAGDVLSIDSSHVLVPGSDVDVLLNDVLPTLPPGVRVHFHDVFLPDDYPPQWAWRGYNEQLGVAALVQGGAWGVDWSSHYVATRLPESLAGTVIARLPLSPGAHESSLWLVREAAG